MNAQMNHPVRPAIPPRLREVPVVTVLRAQHALEYGPVVEALVDGGVRSIELTLSTAGVLEELPALVERFSSRADIGVGTITEAWEGAAAIDGGATYLVTPTANHDVVALAAARGVPAFPGGLTPTELYGGWRSGAAAVKLFPASSVGPGYLAQLAGPFPELPVIPSGGISIEDSPGWITAGSVAVSIGGPLLKDAFRGGSLQELTGRTRELVRLVQRAVEERDAR